MIRAMLGAAAWSRNAVVDNRSFDVFVKVRAATDREKKKVEKRKADQEVERCAWNLVTGLTDEAEGLFTKGSAGSAAEVLQMVHERQREAARGPTEKTIATVFGLILIAITTILFFTLISRVPGTRAAIPDAAATTVPMVAQVPAGPIRVLIQNIFQNFIFSLHNLGSHVAGVQPPGLQKWIDHIVLHLPHFRAQG